MPAAQSPPQKQKSRLTLSAGGAFPAQYAKSLGRAPRARLVAVMMMVSMRPKIHLSAKLQDY
jgi:hypothetical protein